MQRFLVVGLAAAGCVFTASAAPDEPQRPDPIVYPSPAYPIEEAMKGNEAVCEIEISITPTGAPRIHAIACSNLNFCKPARDGIMIMRYAPEDATDARFFYPIEFEVEGIDGSPAGAPLMACKSDALF